MYIRKEIIAFIRAHGRQTMGDLTEHFDEQYTRKQISNATSQMATANTKQLVREHAEGITYFALGPNSDSVRESPVVPHPAPHPSAEPQHRVAPPNSTRESTAKRIRTTAEPVCKGGAATRAAVTRLVAAAQQNVITLLAIHPGSRTDVQEKLLDSLAETARLAHEVFDSLITEARA